MSLSRPRHSSGVNEPVTLRRGDSFAVRSRAISEPRFLFRQANRQTMFTYYARDTRMSMPEL